MSRTSRTLDLSADVIATADIVYRIEELEVALELTYLFNRMESMELDDELANLLALMGELETCGSGDEKWRGEWYPGLLIADHYFTDYARELLEDCGTIPKDLPTWVEIDWDATARNVRMDYTPVEVDGRTYWTR